MSWKSFIGLTTHDFFATISYVKQRTAKAVRFLFARNGMESLAQYADTAQKPLDFSGKSGIMKSREMANGMRRSPFDILSDDEKKHIQAEIKAIGADESVFVFRDGVGTGFSENQGKIFVSANVFKSNDESKHPRDMLSERAVLAHEYYGHYMNRDTNLPVNSWNDEFRASYSAAKNCPNLSDEDRTNLILDALERAKEAGVSIRYNDFIRRVLYG